GGAHARSQAQHGVLAAPARAPGVRGRGEGEDEAMTGMDELGPEARTLLDAARAGLSPDPAAVQRVHARIHAATAGAAAGTALAVKLGVVGLVAAVAIGGGVYFARGPASPAPAPDLALAAPAEPPQRAAA